MKKGRFEVNCVIALVGKYVKQVKEGDFMEIKDTRDYEKVTSEEVLQQLKVDKDKGLTPEEAKKRAAEYGLNEILEKEVPLIKRILKRFWGPIPWMIETAAILSAIVKKWEDFTIIAILLFTNAFIDIWQESKALNTLKILKEKIAKKATVLRDGKFQEIEAKELVPGDIVRVKIGSIVPADIKIIEGDYIQIDQSALTGESLPVTKKVNDVIFSNSIAKQGEVVGVILNTGLNTFFGKTVKLVAQSRERTEESFPESSNAYRELPYFSNDFSCSSYPVCCNVQARTND